MGVPKRTFIDQLTIDTGCKEPELKTAITNWNKADMSSNAELPLSGNVRNVPQCLRIQYLRFNHFSYDSVKLLHAMELKFLAIKVNIF